MTLKYLDYCAQLVSSNMAIAPEGKVSTYIELTWEDGDKGFTVQIFGELNQAADGSIKLIEFASANDCDPEWDRRFVIGFYDGMHQNIYNGTLQISEVDKGLRIQLTGYVADTLKDADPRNGGLIQIDDVVVFT